MGTPPGSSRFASTARPIRRRAAHRCVGVLQPIVESDGHYSDMRVADGNQVVGAVYRQPKEEEVVGFGRGQDRGFESRRRRMPAPALP